LEGKIYQNSQSQILAFQALLHHFERRHGLIGGESNFGEKMDKYEPLDIWMPGVVRCAARES
jgi:hypothetical protein